MTGIKNINKAEVMALKEQVEYQDGQVVSKTLAQNEHVSVTLFSFDKGEEISTHKSGGVLPIPASKTEYHHFPAASTALDTHADFRPEAVVPKYVSQS